MTKTITFMTIAAACGAALALLSLYVSLPMGWIGGLALIGWTILARRKWAELQRTTGLEPGAPERVLRFYSAGTAVLFGHLITGLTYPGIDLHVGHGNFLAIDSWSMIIAMIFAGILFRRDDKIRDERDATITAKGTKAGYLALIAQLIGLSALLGVLPQNSTMLSHFILGNILVAVMLFSILIKYTSQLIGYANDTRTMAAEGLGE